jgi:hypothetical protein
MRNFGKLHPIENDFMMWLNPGLAKWVIAFAFFGCLSSAARAQQQFPPGERIGLPWDWSHEHLVFSNTDDPAVREIIQQDPRAFHQWLRRSRTAAQLAADDVQTSFDTFLQSFDTLPHSNDTFEDPSAQPAPKARSGTQHMKHKKDWGVSLGATKFNSIGATNSAPLYPAKYTYNINGTPNCEGPPGIGDYAAFPTGANGITSTNSMHPNGQASIIIYNNLYSTQGSVGGYCSSNGPTVFAAYVNAACPTTMSSDPILSSPVISLDGTKVAWVTSTGKVQIVTIGSGVLSSGTMTALSPACIGSGSSGGDGATLQTVTLGNSAHNPTSGVSVSEVFVDFNGDAAYVGDNDGFLHKISPFFTATGSLTDTTTAGWQASHSYSLGTLILDNNGFIEKCTTAGTSGSGGQPGWNKNWNATTTDNTVTWTNIGSGGGWPVYVTGSSNHTDSVALNGPVFDFTSKNIFVGDQNGSLYYVLNPTSTAVGSCANGLTVYPCLGHPTATGVTSGGGAQMDCSSGSASPGGATCMVMSNKEGFTDSVVVDSTNSLVITQFSNADNTNAKVEQTNTSLSVFNSATLAGQVNMSYHTGAFDNNYYTSPTSGYYYVCGPGGTGQTVLYRVGFTNPSGSIIALGSVNGTSVTLTVSGHTGNCSPLTEIYNSSTTTAHDWLFLSVDNQGKTTACNSGSCVMSFDLLSFGNPYNSYGSGVSGDIANMNGTGGIIVDNQAPVTQVGPYTVTAASESGTTATITTSTALNVVVGQNIDVENMGSAYAGYNTGSAAVNCVGATCASGATANSFSYTASAGLSSCSSAGTCAGEAFAIGYSQASSLYFMPVAGMLTCGDGTSNTGCGVKLTQAGLN